MELFKKYFLLVESKQSIVNLGFPKIIADLFWENFGKYAFLLAKWYKEYYAYKFKDGYPKNWWWVVNDNRSFSSREGIVDFVGILQSNTVEDYIAFAKKRGLESYHSPMDEYYLNEVKRYSLEYLKDDFKRDYFFFNSLIQDFTEGKIKDISQYKDLSLEDATEKYNQKKISTPPIKKYSNGYKWVDVGPRCSLVGKLMKNCGSAGVMSSDPDKTLIVLFDSENKPHVITTYSPNQQRLSGDQGGGSTEVKPKYHKYILDLANFLNVQFDADNSKSALLSLKYRLKDKIKNIKQIHKSIWYTYFMIIDVNDNKFISNGVYILPKEEFDTYKTKTKTNSKDLLGYLFNPNNIEDRKEEGLNFIDVKTIK